MATEAEASLILVILISPYSVLVTDFAIEPKGKTGRFGKRALGATAEVQRCALVVPWSPNWHLDSSYADPGTASRAKIIICKKDDATGATVEVPDSQTTKKETSGDHAFTLKKVTSDVSSGESYSEIDVINPDLWELLKQHMHHHPYHTFSSSPVTLYSPWDDIIFEWDVLQEAASQAPVNENDRIAREDLRLLLNVISGGSCGDHKLDRYFKNREVYRNQKSIQFDDLWTIFPPGTLIYGRPFQNQDQIFIVQDSLVAWPYRDTSATKKMQPWKLQCWTYDWNGEAFQRTSFALLFDAFEGHRPITSLPYYPFDLVENGEKIKQQLIDRGKLFREYCMAPEGSRLFDYNGYAIFSKKGFAGLTQDSEEDSERRSFSAAYSVDDQVMVDYASYYEYGGSVGRNGSLEPCADLFECNCSECQDNKGLAQKYRTHFDSEEAQARKVWEDEQYMLCPPRVLGYILRQKQWVQLQVTSLRSFQPNPIGGSWESRLQLADENNKKLIYDLIRSHISSTANGEPDDLQLNDIIPEKGKGLVILLYGPPGVGKTSTAETIAIAARKPLFSISVADVGTKAQLVESNLSRIFALATSWQAILLIDEADVFLESRGRGNAASTDKNALVSVFLRVLEYYQGIMFLTTNQIAQFDIAIPSRIHVALKYESLKKEQMQKIFEGFLDPLDNKNLIEDYEGVKEWLAEDVYGIGFDGRQIRNIVSIGLGLARADRKNNRTTGKLTKRHLKRAVHNADAFKKDFLVQMDRYINSQEKMIK
ncbi:P-loop containing nucleoside triphosphate hydrolase protein [Aspergillus egyptiacus]|nr:P-loop containing nucleoside triphosphate hydrolase protein [Aspergillus egyptiacus]